MSDYYLSDIVECDNAYDETNNVKLEINNSDDTNISSIQNLRRNKAVISCNNSKEYTRMLKIESYLKHKEYLFSSSIQTTIWSGTWNINGQKPTNSISDWIFNDNHNNIDIYVISLQEFVSLNLMTIFFNYGISSREQLWLTYLNSLFISHTHEKYICIASETLCGLATFVFVKESLTQYITQLQIFKIPTEIMDFYNKGALMISFYLFNSSILLCNQHAKPHKRNVAKRIKDYQYLTSILLYNKMKVKDYDIVIWMGDLNSHLQTNKNIIMTSPLCSYNTLSQITSLYQQRYSFKGLFLDDEIMQLKHSSNKKYFDHFIELYPNFIPTFKFKPGTLMYQLYKKHQFKPPAWCDRVLYYLSNPNDLNIQTLQSNSQLTLSDHLPVFSVANITVHQYDLNKLFYIYLHYFIKQQSIINSFPLCTSTSTVLHTYILSILFGSPLPDKHTNIHYIYQYKQYWFLLSISIATLVGYLFKH